MSESPKPLSASNVRQKLTSLQKKRGAATLKKNETRSQSLESLRFAGVLKQLQALQAIQGLTELKPKEKGNGRRFVIPADPTERATQRQWLQFKADWLEALLEDTIDELQALDESESIGACRPTEVGRPDHS